MKYAKVTKRGGRKPLIEEGTLCLGAKNFVNGRWQRCVISIGDTGEDIKTAYSVEFGREMAISVAAAFAQYLTDRGYSPTSADRTPAQCLRDLADMIEGKT